jgi:CHASE3 domain sensor protein
VNKSVSRRIRMNLAFGSAVLLLFLSGLAAYSAVMRLLEAEKWVDHTRDVQSTLKDIGNLSARAGRARTQFVDSGDLSFLQDYETSANQVTSKLLRLRQLITDNTAQQESLQHLEQITNHRLDLLKQSVELKQSGSPNVQPQQQLRQKILDVSTDADDLLQTMQDREQQLLNQRTQQSEYLFRITALILCAAFVIALTLLFFTTACSTPNWPPESRPRPRCGHSVFACWNYRIRSAADSPANFTIVSANTWWA